jgi:hypothetical protein
MKKIILTLLTLILLHGIISAQRAEITDARKPSMKPPNGTWKFIAQCRH